MLRDLIAVLAAIVVVVAAFFLGRAAVRRRRARRPGYGPDSASPLSGGLSGPAPASDERSGSPIAAPPRPERRPRLAPVTGLPSRGNAEPSGGPPWEDAPKPKSPPPAWPAARPLPGGERPSPSPSPDTAPQQRTPSLSPDTARQQRTPPGWAPTVGTSGNGTPAAADPDLYEEDPQPFDDEDDRHL